MIDNEMTAAKARADADAELYRATKEAEANNLRLTPGNSPWATFMQQPAKPTLRRLAGSTTASLQVVSAVRHKQLKLYTQRLGAGAHTMHLF